MDILVSCVDSNGPQLRLPVQVVRTLDFVGFRPVRKPASYKGQPNYPGYYHFTQLGRLIPYESRLEMFTLLKIDFEVDVTNVVVQPLMLQFSEGDSDYKHTPDIMVVHKNGDKNLIDVKPRAYVNTERNRRAFAAAKELCDTVGWEFTLQSEVNPVYLTNLKWFAGFRRRPTHLDEFMIRLIELCSEQPTSIGKLATIHDIQALVRPVIFHLIWHRHLSVDMYHPLSEQTSVELGARSYV